MRISGTRSRTQPATRYRVTEAADRGHEVTAHQTDQEHHKVGVEVEVARPAAEDMDAGEVACTPRVS